MASESELSRGVQRKQMASQRKSHGELLLCLYGLWVERNTAGMWDVLWIEGT